MDTQLIHETSSRALAGTISFPDVVANLILAGVEYYHVDYAGRRMTYYGTSGTSAVVTPLTFADLPAVALDFDAPALQAAILDSQRNGQHFHAFSRRAMNAGVQAYFAFLRGQRVTYLGRQGDQHIEWFLGAAPAARQ